MPKHSYKMLLNLKLFGQIKKSFTFKSVFIGYGLKTGQGVYPGPIYLRTILLLSLSPLFYYNVCSTVSKLNPFSKK